MNWQQYIVSDKNVLLGKPAIIGTRISVDHIISLMAQGWSEQKILDNYPRLTLEHLQAVFAYLHASFTVLHTDITNYRFNRDEANER